MYYTGKPVYFEALALGLVPKKSRVYKFGRAEGVTATEQIVSTGGIYGTPSTAYPVTVTSDNPADVPAGAGARRVRLIGLNEKWEEQIVEIDMGVETTELWLRVPRVQVIEAGTISPVGVNGNLGTLTVTQSTSGVQMVQVAPNKGQTLCACYTVPKGYKALVWNADATASEGKNVDFKIVTRINNGNPDAPYRVAGERDAFQNTVDQKFVIPSVLDEKEDIIFVATSSASGANLSATFILELVQLD